MQTEQTEHWSQEPPIFQLAEPQLQGDLTHQLHNECSFLFSYFSWVTRLTSIVCCLDLPKVFYYISYICLKRTIARILYFYLLLFFRDERIAQHLRYPIYWECTESTHWAQVFSWEAQSLPPCHTVGIHLKTYGKKTAK